MDTNWKEIMPLIKTVYLGILNTVTKEIELTTLPYKKAIKFAKDLSVKTGDTWVVLQNYKKTVIEDTDYEEEIEDEPSEYYSF